MGLCLFRFGRLGFGSRCDPTAGNSAGLTVEVARDCKQRIATVHPEKRRYVAGGQVMTEAALLPGATRDLFIALGESLGNDAWALRVHIKPFVRWIWLGALLMALGAVVTATVPRFRKIRKEAA